MIILVRHAMPKLEPGVDPARWTLSDDGVAAAQALGHLLPVGAVLVSSDEPKAHATLTAMVSGRPVTLDPRLREVARPIEPFDDEFRAARLAYVGGHPPDGWEHPAEVTARIGRAIIDHRIAGRPLILAGHGMAFTTWLSAHRLIEDPPAFWSDLRFPDLVLVRDATVRRLA